jgi:hypothetical protein
MLEQKHTHAAANWQFELHTYIFNWRPMCMCLLKNKSGITSGEPTGPEICPGLYCGCTMLSTVVATCKWIPALLCAAARAVGCTSGRLSL